MSVVQRLDKEDLVIDVLDRSHKGGKKEALRISKKTGKVTITDLDATVAAGDLADGAVTTAKLATNAVTTAKVTDLNITTGKLAASAVTKAKAAVSASAEQTGTGASQNVAHGLTGTPSLVLVVPTAGHDGAGAAGTQMPTIVEGAHGGTNVVVTVSAGAKFKVLAWI